MTDCNAGCPGTPRAAVFRGDSRLAVAVTGVQPPETVIPCKDVFFANRAARLFLLITMALAAAPVAAESGDIQTDAQQLLNRMAGATRTLNYDGIFIYRRNHRMDTMRLIHKVAGDGERERLISLTGNAREVIRDNKSVTCIFPETKVVLVEKSRNHELISAQLSEPVEKSAEQYLFSVVDQDRVAGRDAWVVSIKPIDNFRYGYQLWIDKENSLLLKSNLQNISGETLEQILFTKLDVMDEIPDRLLEPSIPGTGFTWYRLTPDDSETENNSPRWQVQWLPTGFKLKNYEKQPAVSGRQVVDHIIFSDGLAMVSVFIEKYSQPSRFIPGSTTKGAVNAFARIANGYQVTAVGEVPQSTVQRMAISVVTSQ